MSTDARRAWDVVLRSVESDLLSGRLKPGDHLPPERALAAELGVGRSSVREAVRVLEVLGLIRTATGSGPTAGAIIIATPSGGMSALMRLQVAAHGFPVSDVVATRLLLEASVVSDLATAISHVRQLSPSAPAGVAQTAQTGAIDATSNAADERLAAAVQLLDAMDEPALTEAEFLALDAQFHVSLAEASGNTVVSAMMAGLRNSIESYVLAAVPNLPTWAVTSARLRAEHRGIIAAIAAGNPVDAATRTRAHIAGYYAESRLTPHPHTSPPHTSPSPSAPEWSFSRAQSDHSDVLGGERSSDTHEKESTHG